MNDDLTIAQAAAGFLHISHSCAARGRRPKSKRAAVG